MFPLSSYTMLCTKIPQIPKKSITFLLSSLSANQRGGEKTQNLSSDWKKSKLSAKFALKLKDLELFFEKIHIFFYNN